jgi:Asp-tRNA(Asn)/Glu-tRNA(Gln) amidotransferase C subunit
MLTRLRFTKAIRPALLAAPRRLQSTTKPFPVDDLGIPLKPTWSVDELLSSYPSPTISHETFTRLHKLSALIPPEKNSPEYQKNKDELEELVKLVEAVRMAEPGELDASDSSEIPDGRIWSQDVGVTLDVDVRPDAKAKDYDILKHASRTEDGYFVVETERHKNRA